MGKNSSLCQNTFPSLLCLENSYLGKSLLSSFYYQVTTSLGNAAGLGRDSIHGSGYAIYHISHSPPGHFIGLCFLGCRHVTCFGQ